MLRRVVCTGETTIRGLTKVRYALILGGLSAFAPVSIDMYLPALPAMAGDLGTDDATLQLSLTVFLVGLAVGQLVIGPLSDALGRRRPLLVGLTVYAAASVVCALSTSAGLLIGARVVQAFAAAAGIVIARASVRDLFAGTAMTKFFSMLMLVNGLAPILAPVAGGQLLRLTSWHGVFVALTLFGVVLLLAVAVALPESLPPSRRRPARFAPTLRTYRDLLADRLFLGYALAASLLFAGMFAYISGSPFVLQELYGLSPQQYGLVFGANGIAIVAVGQLNGFLAGRVPERRLLVIGLGIGAAGGLGTVLATSTGLGLAGLLPPMFVLVGSIGLVLPNAASLGLAAHPRTAGSASALIGMLQFTAGGTAAPLVGLFGGGSALPMTVVMAGFAVAALLAFLLLARRIPAANGKPANPSVSFASQR